MSERTMNDLAAIILQQWKRVQADLIRLGRGVTWEYRLWCSEVGVMLADGLDHPRHPTVFALTDPVECEHCGHRCERRTVEESYAVLVACNRHGSPDLDEPDAYATRCPECGNFADFRRAVTCAECLEYPCICDPADIEGDDELIALAGMLFDQGETRSYRNETSPVAVAGAADRGAVHVRVGRDSVLRVKA